MMDVIVKRRTPKQKPVNNDMKEQVEKIIK